MTGPILFCRLIYRLRTLNKQLAISVESIQEVRCFVVSEQNFGGSAVELVSSLVHHRVPRRHGLVGVRTPDAQQLQGLEALGLQRRHEGRHPRVVLAVQQGLTSLVLQQSHHCVDVVSLYRHM